MIDRLKTTSGVIGVALLAAVGLSGAAISHEGQSDGATKAAEAAFGRPGQATKVTRTIKVEGYEFEFAPAALIFKAGETVKFVFVNTGHEPHELSIGDAAYQSEHRAMMAKAAKEAKARGETVDHATHADDHMHGAEGNVVEAKPGETKELIWQFSKPGTFELACNIPGHTELGMTGTIKVE
jgi:uncharacterized cupredoxin-like copper-binding protein